jgi:hypothetical protein
MRFVHPEAGELVLGYETFDFVTESGLVLRVYHAEPGSPTADALPLLGTRYAGTDPRPYLFAPMRTPPFKTKSFLYAEAASRDRNPSRVYSVNPSRVYSVKLLDRVAIMVAGEIRPARVLVGRLGGRALRRCGVAGVHS